MLSYPTPVPYRPGRAVFAEGGRVPRSTVIGVERHPRQLKHAQWGSTTGIRAPTPADFQPPGRPEGGQRAVPRKKTDVRHLFSRGILGRRKINPGRGI